MGYFPTLATVAQEFKLQLTIIYLTTSTRQTTPTGISLIMSMIMMIMIGTMMIKMVMMALYYWQPL